jgi:hypothetical protein
MGASFVGPERVHLCLESNSTIVRWHSLLRSFFLSLNAGFTGSYQSIFLPKLALT